MEVEAKLEPYLAGSSSSNTKPILVKILVLHLMAIPNKLMIPGGCQGGGGEQVRGQSRV